MAAALGAAFVRGLAGFGMAILLVPVLGLAIAPSSAVVVAHVLGFVVGLPELRMMWRESEHTARIIAALAVMATPLGMALLSVTPPDLARLLIATVAIAAFVIVLLPRRAAGVPRRSVTVLTGLSSGLLSGFAAMPGVPVAPYYLGRAMAPSLARASMMLIFFAVSVAGCVSALALGLGTARDGALALLLVPAILLGNWLGARAFGRISPMAWRWFAGAVLGASALGAVLRAL